MSEPRTTYDEKTLAMTREILRMSMSDNDMARGARATAYALLLLGRLIHHYKQPEQLLPTDFPIDEEDFVSALLDDAEPIVLKRTGGKPLKLIVQKLVQEAQANRKQRRSRNRHHHQRRNSRPEIVNRKRTT